MTPMLPRWSTAGAVSLVLAGMIASSLAVERGEDLHAKLARFVEAHPRDAACVRERAVLHGDAHDGDAMPFYQVAARALGRSSPRDETWWGPNATAASREAAWPALEPIVCALRAGAQGRSTAMPVSLDWWRLCEVMGYARRRAADRGEWGLAVELWLDAMAFRLDVVEPYMLDADFLAAWSVDRLLVLDRPAVALLAEGLRRLDARWPRQVDMAARLVDWAKRLQLQAPSMPWRQRLQAWRSGFDSRQGEVAACCELIDALPELQSPGASWPERCKQWQAFAGHLREGTGTFQESWVSWVRGCEHRLHANLACLRLLRLALAFHCGEPLPELADPFAAAPLQVQIDGDVATFRSAATPTLLQVKAVRR